MQESSRTQASPWPNCEIRSVLEPLLRKQSFIYLCSIRLGQHGVCMFSVLGHGQSRKITEACRVFELMNQRSIASWSAIIAAYANSSMRSECLGLFRIMNNEGCWRAEESILASVLSTCTHLGALGQGKSIHAYILRNLSTINFIVQTTLVDMYVKCGCLEKGLILFQGMEIKNHMSYSVVISGLASHGRGEEALEVFTEMLGAGLVPDDVVYVSVLSACGRAGLFKEGLTYFDRMIIEHGIEPTIQHYGCMVDLFGRSGMLAEALELIHNMPMEPNDVIWRSLLSSCKFHQNLQLGEIAFKKLSQLQAENASDYLMLSNLYAQFEKWESVAMIRTKMVEKGISQVPGSSFVEVNKKMYRFVSQDMKYPQCEGVYEMLHQMEWQLKFEGYKADISQVLLIAEDDEKREKLRTHSQKLAIAFALVHTSPDSPVRIVRNVRMCDDCHRYTKLISRIYERDIIVKYGNRFHHFKGGVCSCKDYY
ncbi:hypothetical protein Leryth_021155 [Lithospermum erythrorhizon]|nr:hypothetical protein Leryth_021155 [Lithospermum erythrorhizon]